MGSNKKTRQDQEDDVSSDRLEVRLLVESLMEARRLANDLKACLQLEQSSSSMDPLPLAAGGAGAGAGAAALPALVEGISESLSRAIMLLQSQSTGRRSPLMAPAPARRGSGGYKRRTQVSQGCRKEFRSSMDDGYSWRKYGQKEIFAAKYPRSYYRCKHKYKQLCPATRQVQQSEADPSMFDITYIGDHTCTQKQQAIMDNGITKREDVLSPSTEFESGRGHRAPADHESTRGDDGAPAHLDGSFSYGTAASDLQVMALELGGHAYGPYGDDVTFDGRCYTNTYYTAAAGDDFDDVLAAAASSFGDFTSTSTSAI